MRPARTPPPIRRWRRPHWRPPHRCPACAPPTPSPVLRNRRPGSGRTAGIRTACAGIRRRWTPAGLAVWRSSTASTNSRPNPDVVPLITATVIACSFLFQNHRMLCPRQNAALFDKHRHCVDSCPSVSTITDTRSSKSHTNRRLHIGGHFQQTVSVMG